jgi:hypothetical protein
MWKVYAIKKNEITSFAGKWTAIFRMIKVNVFSYMRKIDPKYNCIYKYKHNHIYIYVYIYRMLIIVTLINGLGRERTGKRMIKNE